MKIEQTEALLDIARRLVWFENSEEALSQPYVFVAQVMTHGSLDDVLLVQSLVGHEGFQETLDSAPPGSFDPRSWAYWNLIYKRCPTPDMPTRRFD